MSRESTTPDPAAWTDWGGDGPVLHFAHANGFPPASYRRLISALLPRFHVVTLGARPLWAGADPAALRGWPDLADDLRRALRDRGLSGVVGVGHSVGAVCTATAAGDDPGLFRALVLIDPVLFTGARAAGWWALQRLGQVHRTPIVAGALRRCERWPSRQAVQDSWAGRPFFARWDPRCLQDYLDAGLVPAGDGVGLRYPKAWEARVFETTPACAWTAVRRIPVPCLVLRGERTDTFTAPAAARFRRELPSARIVDVAGTDHLLPMERPDAVARAIVGFAEGTSGR